MPETLKDRTAPLWWTVSVALVGLGLATVPIAVLDAWPQGDLTPSAYGTFQGALAPVLTTAGELGRLYLVGLLVFGVAAWIKRGSLAGAALGTAILVSVAGWAHLTRFVDRGLDLALAAGIAFVLGPTVAYGVVAALERTEKGRLHFLALTGFAAAAPLELYWVQWQTQLAVETAEALQGWSAGALLSVLWLLTAAPALALAGTKNAKAAMAMGLAGLLLVATDGGAPANAASTAPLLGAEIEGPRHIVLLSADTLRADAIAPYDASQQTPSLAQLAQDSTVFRNAFSPAPWTLPSVTSMLTGYAPEVHGVGLALEEAALPTLAEMLAQAGYRTAAFCGNPILTPGAKVLDARNQPHFEFYRGMDASRVFEVDRLGRSRGAAVLYGREPEKYLVGGTTTDQTAYVVDWLEDNADEPFFLWAHYYDPHWPFAPPRDFLPEGVEPPPGAGRLILDAPAVRTGVRTMNREERKWMETLYAAEVRHVDRAIGRVLDKLVELGVYEDALIVFTSDHGEEFWEHRRYGHGHAIYPEVLRVPLLVKQPVGETPKSVEASVSVGALTPTLLDLAGVAHDVQKGWSPSLGPLARGDTNSYPHPIFASAVEMFENQESVIFDGMQLIRHIDTAGVELYDLENDPFAQRPVTESRPEAVERGLALLEERREEAADIRRGLGFSLETETKWDEETLERLRALGYL